ncbi:MAG TPA: glycoside hydrolase family 3 N-terminal domain-containing protein [Bacteroidales bacterium]|jgi:beta-N-acetylhexosaminidase|nr:glycoside hydrolase family 3 N-terminal domain-containing protein [Bacteroidales bacterium]
MMRKILMGAIALPLILSISCSKKSTQSSHTSIAMDTSWKQLTLREKIGQTMMVTTDLYAQKKIGNGSLQEFFAKYPIGGFFVAQWHFTYQKPDDLIFEEFIPRIMREYDSASKFPLFFSEDFERGAGYNYNTCTKLPVLMTLGAANSKDLAYAYGKIVSAESRSMGFNWLLHPVADLNMNPLHPLVIERAISDNAELALPLLQSQLQAMKDQNVISTIKHFPGDGVTICDQHLITSANNLPMDQWRKTFGKVFQTLIDEGVPTIMVGHLQFPAYQKETIHGELPPATLSREIMQQLLKQEMGFKGVVVSDAMNMGGASGFYDNALEASVKCFEAGADMILWPSLAYMDTVEARILRGEIPMQRLDDAVERIWALREKYGLLTKKATISTPLPPNHAQYVQEKMTELATKAVTLIQDKNNDIPLSPNKTKKIFMVNISHNDKRAVLQTMKKELESRGFQVRLEHDFHLYNWEWRWDSLAQYDKFIVCFENKYFDPIGSPLLKDKEAYCLWSIKNLPKEKIISVSFSNPYYNTFYLKTAPVLINAYSSDDYMQKAVVQTLMGEIKPTAKSPVNLYHQNMK